MDHFGVHKGQIYLAADRSRCGHVVLGEPLPNGDVLVQPFTSAGVFTPARLIDCFKLAMVRYYHVADTR